MIRYSLKCGGGHQFDAWFSSSGSYDEQCEAEVIRCPECGASDVQKAPMAPAVLRGRKRATPGGATPETGVKETPAAHAPEGQTYAFLKGLREHLKANADDVGDKFAEEARKMHHGEAEERSIYGEASSDEAKSLYEEGIPALPLPKLPKDHN
ncbi:MAG: DUF1178 family protein [Pseudomonadota bacterium]